MFSNVSKHPTNISNKCTQIRKSQSKKNVKMIYGMCPKQYFRVACTRTSCDFFVGGWRGGKEAIAAPPSSSQGHNFGLKGGCFKGICGCKNENYLRLSANFRFCSKKSILKKRAEKGRFLKILPKSALEIAIFFINALVCVDFSS